MHDAGNWELDKLGQVKHDAGNWELDKLGQVMHDDGNWELDKGNAWRRLTGKGYT